MKRFAILGLIVGLLVSGLAAYAGSGISLYATYTSLHTPAVSEAPLIAPCGSGVGSLPFAHWQENSDTVYQSKSTATGSGSLTFTAGTNSATISTPCNPCTINVNAPAGSGQVQLSLTANAASCPSSGIVVTLPEFIVHP